jgi:hypothetical protein
MHDIIMVFIGFVVGGVACAVSAKTLGWFNKQVGSIETKVIPPKP